MEDEQPQPYALNYDLATIEDWWGDQLRAHMATPNIAELERIHASSD